MPLEIWVLLDLLRVGLGAVFVSEGALGGGGMLSGSGGDDWDGFVRLCLESLLFGGGLAWMRLRVSRRGSRCGALHVRGGVLREGCFCGVCCDHGVSLSIESTSWVRVGFGREGWSGSEGVLSSCIVLGSLGGFAGVAGDCSSVVESLFSEAGVVLMGG